MKRHWAGALALTILAGCSTTDNADEKAATATLVGKTFTGKWDSVAPSTLKILNESQVRYCFRSECTTTGFTGIMTRQIKFSWGDSSFTFTKSTTGFRGVYKGGDGSTSSITMS